MAKFNVGTTVERLRRASKHSLNDLSTRINISDTNAICTTPLCIESFKLQNLNRKNRVANYSDSILEEYWNTHIIKQSVWRHMYKKMKYGVISKALPTVSLYLIGHYTFVLLILFNMCNSEDDTKNNTGTSTEVITRRFVRLIYNNNETMVSNVTFFCENYSGMNEFWREKEHSMTRVLTLLLGFYVGFVVRAWWTKLRILPSMDSLCIAIGGFICIDSHINEDEVFIKLDQRKISIKQFKKDIVRLFLLSWTMCMSRASKPLKALFPKAKDFSDKQLLTTMEYKQLTTCTKDDCWLEKWSTPLIWVIKMVNSIDKNTKVTDADGNVEEGVKFKEVKDIAIALYKFKDQLQSLSNQHFYKIPDLMLQCISFSLYFSFMFLGVFAGQGMVFDPEDDRSLFERLLADFPIYYCVKYGLLISWLRAAQDLQSPFGTRDHVHDQ